MASRLSPDLAAGIPSSIDQASLLEGLQVLVVDDDADSRDLITAVLSSCGASVLSAASAAEARTFLKLFQPQVLISDLRMPEEDGYTFLERLRRSGSVQHLYNQLPAIAWTACAMPEDCSRALLAGYQRYLSKPADLDELITAVADVTGRLGSVPCCKCRNPFPLREHCAVPTINVQIRPLVTQLKSWLPLIAS